MKMILTPFHFQEIIKKGYSLDVVFMLSCVAEQISLGADSAKLSALQQTLVRKGLVTDSGDKLTTLGEDLLKYISVELEESDKSEESFVPFIKKKINSEEFDEWWKLYPANDGFEFRGRTFKRTRPLRVDPDNCKIKFEKIVAEGKYTAEELRNALSLEISDRKNNSVREGKNCLTFMVASTVYLNQRRFESYIEDIRKGTKVELEDDIEYGING